MTTTRPPITLTGYWPASAAARTRCGWVEIDALEADRGRHLGYVRTVVRRTDAAPDEPITSIPARYVAAPLLRG